MTPDKLEKYSFFWSELRLIIAAVALFIGGVPPILLINPAPSMYGLVHSLLTLSWVISGVASLYLLYRWNKGGQMVFGGKTKLDVYAFFVMIVSGINLGIAGVLGRNLGMTISPGRIIFLVTGIVYLVALYHLHKRFKEYGGKIF